MTSRVEYDRISPDYEPYKLSIDGRSLAYRDPNNPQKQDHIIDSRSTNRDIYGNEDAYNMTNPLYDYSYGEMRRAGEALGIRNINDKEEVERMLEYMSKPNSPVEEAKEENEEPVSTTPVSDQYAQRGAPLSDKAQQAQDFVNQFESSIRDGSFNDSYTPNAVSSNQSFAREMLNTQMKNASTDIDIDNFSQQREEMKQKSVDNFNKKLYGDEENTSYS